MILKNSWDVYQIKNLSFKFDNENYGILVEFDFTVIESYDYLEKLDYTNVKLFVADNLPYTMLLEKIFEKCNQTIDI